MYLVRDMAYVFIYIYMYIYRTIRTENDFQVKFFGFWQIRITSNRGRNMFDVFEKYIKCVVFHILNQ